MDPTPARSDRPGPPALPDFAVIEARREALGVSQAALCRRAGISDGTYVRLKKGDNAARVTTRRVLADALELFARERTAKIGSFAA